MGTATYVGNAELPDLTYEWRDAQGTLYSDMDSGWSFEVRIWREADPGVQVVKTTGITGAASVPNVRAVWSAGERDLLDEGVWTLDLTATRLADGKRRRRRDTLQVI